MSNPQPKPVLPHICLYLDFMGLVLAKSMHLIAFKDARNMPKAEFVNIGIQWSMGAV